MAIVQPFAVAPALIGPVTSGNELANRPASHLGYLDYIGMVWRSSGPSNLWARGQFFAQETIDFVALVNATALPGTTIRVRLGTSQAEVDGTAPYDSGALPFISPSIGRDDGLYHSHLELGSAVNATWWRIDIGGHTGDFEASGLVMGKKLQPARFYDTAFEHGFKDLGALTIAPGGVVSETPGVGLRTLAMTFSWMTEAEFYEKFAPMVRSLLLRGLSYWCFDPAATAYRQDKSYLGYFTKEPFARGRQKPGTFGMEFNLLSLI